MGGEVKINQKRKRKLILQLLIILFLTIVSYYFIYVLVTKGFTDALCLNRYCLELLDFSDFFTIILSFAGLYFIVDSLDSWKDQEAYYNSRETLGELNEIILNCEIFSIADINNYTNYKDHQEFSIENRKEIKSLLPVNAINSNFDKLRSLIESRPIYHRKDFIELMGEIQKIINKMHRVVDNENISFYNIGSRINIAIRDDIPHVNALLIKLQENISKAVE